MYPIDIAHHAHWSSTSRLITLHNLNSLIHRIAKQQTKLNVIKYMHNTTVGSNSQNRNICLKSHCAWMLHKTNKFHNVTLNCKEVIWTTAQSSERQVKRICVNCVKPSPDSWTRFLKSPYMHTPTPPIPLKSYDALCHFWLERTEKLFLDCATGFGCRQHRLSPSHVALEQHIIFSRFCSQTILVSTCSGTPGS